MDMGKERCTEAGRHWDKVKASFLWALPFLRRLENWPGPRSQEVKGSHWLGSRDKLCYLHKAAVIE